VVLALKGTQTTAKVTDVGDGSYNVEYTPSDIGNFWTLTSFYSKTKIAFYRLHTKYLAACG